MRRYRRHDRQRVNVLSRCELAYWTSRLGVTVEELRAAVCRVGPTIERVAQELGKGP